MPERSREWLQSFLRLGERTGVMTVPPRDIVRQEDTVLRALRMLDDQPGVVLADEVGMGKTYEALGVIAARHQEDPTRRTLVLTPGPDLNEKWKKEFRAFSDDSSSRTPMYAGFKGLYAAAPTLRDLLHEAKTHSILIAPVTMFAGGRAMRNNAYLLSLYLRWKQLHGTQVAAVFRRYRDGELSKVDVTDALFLDEVGWDRIEPVLDATFGAPGLDIEKIVADPSYAVYERTDHVDRALAQLRFRLLRALLPQLDLLVVDEAHKLKNPNALRAIAVREAFDGKFGKALFLTATPFQLDVSELKQVLDLFSLAQGAPKDLGHQASQLLSHVDDYKAAYAAFEAVWRRLDELPVADFRKLHAEDPELRQEPEDPSLATVLARARKLLELKRTHIEPGLRRWMIRSLREDKRVYRRPVRTALSPKGGAGVPFLLYERFIAELFRSKAKTHKAAVQINMVSSYGAAREGAILDDELKKGLGGEAEDYRQLLRKILDGVRDEPGAHPKLDFVLRDALDAAASGQKTLIFCARLETLSELSKQISAAWTAQLVERWRAVDPAATVDSVFDTQEPDESRQKGRHSRFRDRLHRSADQLFLALRERYLQTTVDLGSFARDRPREVESLANEVLSQQRVTKTRAERFDWALAKRCVESAVARLAVQQGVSVEDPAALERLASDDFVRLGFNHSADKFEHDDVGPDAPEWRIGDDQLQAILHADINLWSFLKGNLEGVPPDQRVLTVERLVRYLASAQVPFLVEVLTAARAAGLDVDSIEAGPMVRFMDSFWRTEQGRQWIAKIRSFLLHVGAVPEEGQIDLLEALESAGDFVRQTARGESREKLREAFNTPLYPMVLIANEVMQEGLDLHHQCARVVHHDLAWNPAQLEQRVGRVDRLGGLIQRNRTKNAQSKLDILYPLVSRTIDERLERVVRAREKWLEFLLGAAPDLDEYRAGDEAVPDLPQGFADALRIELGPTL